MRIRLDSIGCRLNISEIERMGRDFVRSGHRLVGPGDVADLYVFNSCAVTGNAAKRSRQIIRQMRKANPEAVVVATGCYTELEPGKVEEIGVNLIVPNEQKDVLPQLLADHGLLKDADPIPDTDADAFTMQDSANHTRAFVKVQDGCKNKCTFCIVTVARGASRSRSIEDVVAEVKELVSLGYKEAVISGVHLGSYGQDYGDPRGLIKLVNAILDETDLERLRMSSLEPWDLEPDFFELWQNPRLLPHLHLPLQSGNDATLRRMARKTSQESFRALVHAARAAIPNVGISTDVIVGFPGETDEEFEDSIAFIEEMNFSKLHIFRYSRREGTAAANMPNQVDGNRMKDRSQRMHELGAKMEADFNRQFVGQTLPVLWHHKEEFGFGYRWSGLTDNYIRVVTDTMSSVDLHNQVLDTEILELMPGGLLGQTEHSNTLLIVETA